MSNTSLKNAQDTVRWIQDNRGFWNSEVLELRQSPYGGVGVFAKQDIDPTLNSTVLLRLHKNSILSSKTSRIANLIHETGIDGALGLIIAFIYEKEAGEESPWYQFIKGIKYEDANGLVLPPSLWEKKEKFILKGSELEMMKVLDEDENQIQFERACEFALHHYQESNKAIPIPWVLDIKGLNANDLVLKYKSFIAICHAVASRDFEIDEYHEVGLVPGACLFNHSSKPSVRFESLFDVCAICGDSADCHHTDGFSDDDNDDDDDDDDEMGEHERDGQYEDKSDQEHSDGEDEDDDGHSSGSEIDSDEDFEGSLEEFIEIIDRKHEQKLLQDQLETDAIARFQNGERPESEIDNGEEEDEGNDQGPVIFEDDDKIVLPDDCCDIVLNKKVKKGDEIFNSYGDFANTVLLSKYGFVVPDNPHNTVGLGLQFIKLRKQYKKQYGRHFDWWEKEGFDLTRDYLFTKKNDCDDEGCEGCTHDDDQDEENDKEGSNWAMECELLHSGEPSPITYALLKLLTMNRNEWIKFLNKPRKINFQVLTTKSTKALKILQELVQMRSKDYDVEVNIKKLLKSKNSREALAAQVLRDEKDILRRSLEYINKKT